MSRHASRPRWPSTTSSYSLWTRTPRTTSRQLPVKHCIKPTKGWEICDALKEYAGRAAVIEKPTFGSTELPAAVKDADDITLVGLCTDICVISNALLLKAFYPEKKIAVDANCCAGVTPESHKNALEVMKMCQIDIVE